MNVIFHEENIVTKNIYQNIRCVDRVNWQNKYFMFKLNFKLTECVTDINPFYFKQSGIKCRGCVDA